MTTCKMTKMTSGTYNFSASYEINQEHNGIEISFSEKPGDIIREELKKLGFRWHNVKKVWYAKNRADRLALAERLATREQRMNEEKEAAHAVAVKKFEEVQERENGADTLEIPASKFVDGGGLYDGWEGGNNRKWHTDKELKALLLADFKRTGIAATIRFNKAGYLTSITVTIRLSASDIRSYDDWKEDFHVVAGRWNYYTDDAGNVRDIYGENYYSLPDAEQKELFENIRRTAYDLEVKHLTESGNCHNSAESVLTDDANKRFETVRAIVASYNRDQSNSMIDYFDRDIYDHYTFKIA